MINKIQKGNRIRVTATTAVSAGDFVMIGIIAGVAMTSAAVGEDFIADLKGVFEVPKLATDVVTQGEQLYWDSTNKVMTVTATNNTKVGPAFAAAAATDTTVLIRLV